MGIDTQTKRRVVVAVFTGLALVALVWLPAVPMVVGLVATTAVLRFPSRTTRRTVTGARAVLAIFIAVCVTMPIWTNMRQVELEMPYVWFIVVPGLWWLVRLR